MIVVSIVVLLLLIILAIISYFLEKRAWNNGICRICDEPLKNFDRGIDSQGGRGYVCKNHHYRWISWPIDRKKRGLINIK